MKNQEVPHERKYTTPHTSPAKNAFLLDFQPSPSCFIQFRIPDSRNSRLPQTFFSIARIILLCPMRESFLNRKKWRCRRVERYFFQCVTVMSHMEEVDFCLQYWFTGNKRSSRS